jgi:hypothetical protein
VRVLIESPYGTNPDGSRCTDEEIAENVEYLRLCILDCLRRGESPYASHGFFPGILDDSDPEQRTQGIEAGLEWGKAAELVAVYCDRGITRGMRIGMDRHAKNGILSIYRHLKPSRP